jgi:DNA repair protein RadC
MNANVVKTERPAAYAAYATETKVRKEEDLIIKKAVKILESRLIIKSEYFTNPLDTENYLKLKLSELEHEEFHCLFLDGQYGLIKHECLFTGTVDGVNVYPREVIKKALQYNAAALIFAHNHPSGNCEPSQADLTITEKLKDCAYMFDIRVLEHIIIGGLDAYSLDAHGQI